jgi:ParB family chromosome partitioning protein
MKTVQIVAIEKVRVINSRVRSEVKFKELTGNIGKVGLKRPITVSPRADGSDGYDLVCGQGRLEACVALGYTEVPAVVVDAPLQDRYLMSLVENLARPPRTTLQLAREIQAQKERGASVSAIAAKVGLSEKYVTDLARLIQKGEERLVEAVERGEVPLGVAMEIATADDEEIQRSLTEAYETGKLKGKALLRVRKLLETRRVRGKTLRGGGGHRSTAPGTDDIIRTYRRETQRQEVLVKKAHASDQQLRFIVSAIKQLFEDETLVSLLRAEALDGMPKYLADAMVRR